jgi:hypothetical protein
VCLIPPVTSSEILPSAGAGSRNGQEHGDIDNAPPA